MEPLKPFSLFIPVFNEEDLLETNTEIVKSYLSRRHFTYEIVIVDNGSTDSTSEIGRDLMKKYKEVRFYTVPKRGPGYALKRALFEFRYENVVFIDIDLSINLSFIEEAASLLDSYTVVIGSKKRGKDQRNILRVFAGSLFVRFVQLILGLPYSDYSIGGKAFRKSFLLENIRLIDDRTNYVLSLIYAAYKKGERIIEIPVFCDDKRKSRFSLLSEIFYRSYMVSKLRLGKVLKKP
ncbi:MAG: glycosyltransferase [Desulfobacterota bacterium]|nr:glycosyltransferase [Thermodesulfobacteriota bacterium]MDW8001590.1 glycosyltransferase [Deltaproteobacteria bacterium]